MGLKEIGKEIRKETAKEYLKTTKNCKHSWKQLNTLPNGNVMLQCEKCDNYR